MHGGVHIREGPLECSILPSHAGCRYLLLVVARAQPEVEGTRTSHCIVVRHDPITALLDRQGAAVPERFLIPLDMLMYGEGVCRRDLRMRSCCDGSWTCGTGGVLGVRCCTLCRIQLGPSRGHSFTPSYQSLSSAGIFLLWDVSHPWVIRKHSRNLSRVAVGNSDLAGEGAWMNMVRLQISTCYNQYIPLPCPPSYPRIVCSTACFHR